MWLINAATLRLESFHDAETAPPYAILSHTWGAQEVSFEDFERIRTHDEVHCSHTFYKIQQCCRQALADGLGYAWVDTCCIDKKSSAELSEAINSMFNWYKNSAVCYAYLEDVYYSKIKLVEGRIFDEAAFRDSRWFKRGWTLQELIAPKEVVFYANSWKSLGRKTYMTSILSSITGVSKFILVSLIFANSSRQTMTAGSWGVAFKRSALPKR